MYKYARRYAVFMLIVSLLVQPIMIVNADSVVDYTITYDGGTDDYIVGAGHFEELSSALAVCTDDGDDDVLIIQLGSDAMNALPIFENGTNLLDNNALISATYTGWIEIQRWGVEPEEHAGYGVNIPDTVSVTFDNVEILDDIQVGQEFSYNWDFYAVKVSAGGNLHLKGGDIVLNGQRVSAIRNDAGTVSITDGANITMMTNSSYAIKNVGGNVTVNNENGILLTSEDDSVTCINTQSGEFSVVAGTIRAIKDSSSAFNNETNSVITISGGIIETINEAGRTIVNYESTLNITGGIVRSTNSDTYTIYMNDDAIMNMSGGTISCSNEEENMYAIRVVEGTLDITGGIIESGTNNIRLQDTDADDESQVKLGDATIYSSENAEIYIKGEEIDSKYTLKSDNYEAAQLVPEDYDDGMTFQWTSNAERTAIISEILSPTLGSLITGDNAGVTKIYLAKEIIPFDPSFESGLSGVTVADGQIVENEQIVDNSVDGGPVWKVQSNGSKMLSLVPTDSYYWDDDAIEDLEISDDGYDYLLEQFDYNFYDVGYMYVDRDFEENEEFSMAWQYVSTDYDPYNDGSFASFVNLDDSSSIPLIDGVKADVSILGATVLGTGNYSTGDYGATGWQTVRLKANASGTYRIGFVIFNLEDEEYSPWLFVDDAAGVTLKDGVTFGAIEKDENAPPPAGEVVEGEDDTAPILTAGAVSRTSETTGTVKFTSNEEGTYYYMIVADGEAAPSVDTSGGGTVCTTSETTIANPTGLAAGAKDIYIKVKDAAGNVSSALKIDIVAYTTGSNDHEKSNDQAAVVVIVNGIQETAGKEIRTVENGQTTVTVEVDSKVIESKIDEAIKNNTTGEDNVIQVPVLDIKSDVAIVELTGDIVKMLETNTFDVSVKRDNIEYIIPAEEFAISKVAESLGVPEKDLVNIKVEVKITKLDEKVVEKYNEVAKANGAELVFPPVAFEVVAKTTKADGTIGEVEINKFSNYVERVMEIPSGVDPNKITTGIVFNPDGTYSHVPTEVFQKDGKWYARINSLTNSNYSVVWNPVTVKSVEKHWSKDAVNDMASRMVIFNHEKFEPNKAITRADFAEYIVRALGLYREGSRHENKFMDVSTTGDRTLAILIANEYDIVSGYPDGTFRPDASITREEAMTMYQRAMKITNLVGTDNNRYQSYTDYNQVGSWATSYTQAVLSAHVFNGTTATNISPKSNLTYAEAAQAIKNLLVEAKLINK